MLAGFAVAASGAVPPGLAEITLNSPHSLAGVYSGYFFAASALPTKETGELLAFVPAGDTSGCAAFEAPAGGHAMAVMESGGNCTLFQKVSNAEDAGVQGIMLVSGASGLNRTEIPSEQRLQIFVVGVAPKLGEKIVQWSLAHGQSDSPVMATISVYKGIFPLFDPSVLSLVALAMSLIVAGAWFATADLRLGSPLAPLDETQVLEIQWWLPFVWVLGASTALVVLYFTMQWLIWIVLLVFGFGGAGCIAEIGHACLRYRWTSLQKKACSLPLVGAMEVAQVIALATGLSVGVAWFVLRKTQYAWPFQNIIGICFLCFFQRSIRLPSIKLASSLLTLMFLFDIFWVFASRYSSPRV